MIDWIAQLFFFDGRVGRGVFWVTLLAYTVCIVVASAFFVGSEGDGVETVAFLVSLLTLWPMLAIQAKRLHDLELSGVLLLLYLMPFLGGIVLVTLMGFFPGTPGVNRYGPQPVRWWLIGVDKTLFESP